MKNCGKVLWDCQEVVYIIPHGVFLWLIIMVGPVAWWMNDNIFKVVKESHGGF